MKTSLPAPSTTLVWMVALVVALFGLGHSGILDNNEGLYAEIAREMLVANDWRSWVIPHLNGLPYMEKPPLLYWLTGLSFAVFGINEWAARLVPALSALACVAMLLRFGRATGHAAAGRLAALIFISGAGVVAMSRLLMFDMLLTACVTGALLSTWIFLQKGRAADLRWAYVALALAVLTKGLVTLALAGLVILASLLLAVQAPFWRSLRALLKPSALLLFLVLAAPWHIAADLVEPSFSWFYFHNEHVLRFLGKREPHDYYGGPWWYYLPRMLIYLFPWTMLALLRFTPLRGGDDASLRRFLFAAWLLPLIFFSVSSAKANYYLVAVMPFLAMHLALTVVQRDWRDHWLRLAPALVLTLLCAVLAWVAFHRTMPDRVGVVGFSDQQFLVRTFAGAAILGVLLVLLAWRRPTWVVLPMLSVALWLGGSMALALDARQDWISCRTLAREIQHSAPEREVILYRDFEKASSLAFYLQRPLRVVESISADLHWGSRLRPNEMILSQSQLQSLVATQKLVLVVTDEHRPRFEASPLASQFKALSRRGNVSAFVNQ
jgi:4-amino-4-deoxy-L-arabinose transferase-like glycosyltransferase